MVYVLEESSYGSAHSDVNSLLQGQQSAVLVKLLKRYGICVRLVATVTHRDSLANYASIMCFSALFTVPPFLKIFTKYVLLKLFCMSSRHMV
jgi:hypothetical protein